MSFTRPGKDVAIVSDPATGKVDFTFDDTNNFAFDNMSEHAVASLLVEHRGEWWADTTGKRGSQIHTVRELRRSTPSALEAFADEALQRATDASIVQGIPEVHARMKRNGATIEVRYKAPDGTDRTLLQPIGDT